MVELVYTGSPSVVLANADVPFNTVIGGCNACERYEANTNTLTLVRPGRYLISATANVALPTGGTAGTEMDLAITAGGAAITCATMSSTPPALEQYNSVATQAVVMVYPGCCRTIGIKNVGTVSVEIADQNLVAVRIGG